MAFVYILQCRDGSLYTGAAVDWKKRFEKHQNGKGAKYTRSRRPLSIVFLSQQDSWEETLKEEARIKKLNRKKKEELVKNSSLLIQISE